MNPPSKFTCSLAIPLVATASLLTACSPSTPTPETVTITKTATPSVSATSGAPSSAAASSAPASTKASAPATSAAAPATSENPIRPMGEVSLADKESKVAAGTQLSVTDVRAGSHEGFDRVVIEFAGTGVPGWHVSMVQEPTQQASGRPVYYEGKMALNIMVFGISMPSDPAVKHNAGPQGQTNGVEDVSWFEGAGQYVVGMNDRYPYSVTALESPTRLVIDITHQR